MKKIAAAALAAAVTVGLAPTAHADVSARDFCLPVMALGVNPYDLKDYYVGNILESNPDLTFNELKALVETAYNSFHYHQNPTCDGVTIPENY